MALLRNTIGDNCTENHPGHLHGLCPCPAPSSSSSGADGRGAVGPACFAVCYTSRARPAISSFSVTE